MPDYGLSKLKQAVGRRSAALFGQTFGLRASDFSLQAFYAFGKLAHPIEIKVFPLQIGKERASAASGFRWFFAHGL
jgi:hypothetical protein